MRQFIILPFFLSTVFAEVWNSSDGRQLEAKGLSWNEEGLLVKRTVDHEQILIPFDRMQPSEVKRALGSLPFRTNDSVRVSARSVSISSNSKERETGNYVANVRLYRYDGYNIQGHATITPITEKFRVSGRVVEVELSSILGNGHVGLEFYAIRGSGSERAIYNSQIGVVQFQQHGSKAFFSAPETENFQGWVVIVRSPNTSKIISIQSSMRHLENFVQTKLPETAKILLDLQAIQQSILNP